MLWECSCNWYRDHVMLPPTHIGLKSQKSCPQLWVTGLASNPSLDHLSYPSLVFGHLILFFLLLPFLLLWLLLLLLLLFLLLFLLIFLLLLLFLHLLLLQPVPHHRPPILRWLTYDSSRRTPSLSDSENFQNTIPQISYDRRDLKTILTGVTLNNQAVILFTQKVIVTYYTFISTNKSSDKI